VTLRTLVVDDEELPRERIRELVAAHPALTLVGEATNGVEALDALAEHRAELVFLDIQMPELDGLQVAAALPDDPSPAVVFVTAYDAYAVRAFEVDAIDYLLKPVSSERFDAAVARVLERVGQGPPPGEHEPIRELASKMAGERGYTTRFVARRGSRHYFVRTADIDWVEAVGNYVRLCTGETTHMIRETMKGMEARLDPAQFVRIHRSAMVAIDRVRSIEPREHGEYLVTMQTGARLVSSRTYTDRLRAIIRERGTVSR
jgi:two-component system LytT family response regulator